MTLTCMEIEIVVGSCVLSPVDTGLKRSDPKGFWLQVTEDKIRKMTDVWNISCPLFPRSQSSDLQVLSKKLVSVYKYLWAVYYQIWLLIKFVLFFDLVGKVFEKYLVFTTYLKSDFVPHHAFDRQYKKEE